MLTLGAYLRYVGKLSLSSYLLVLLLFALGLMCKPMLVTLPFVLLLLDYWPLKRVIDFRTLGRFAFEKIPLLSLSLASCVATISAQREAVGAAAQLPLSWRINNALVGYVTYIAQTFWPAKLAPFYPHPEGHLPVLEIILAAGFLIGISAIAVALRKQRPYILVGWLWYLGMLVPVIGVFQIGLQSHADRYTYLPQIGLLISFTWGIVDLWALWWRQRAVLAIVSASVVAILAGLAWRQTSYWRNSETLWRHALAVTADNDLARTSLGMFYDDSGRRDLAISQYESALKIRSAHPEALCNVTYLVHYDLGNALLHEGKFDDAIAHYKKAVQLRPNYASAYYNLGAALFYKGQLDDAIAQWQTTLAMQPDHAEAHAGLGTAFLRKGSLGEAINHYEKAIAAPVPSLFALDYLAWILSTCSDVSFRNGPRGVELAQQAVRFSGGKNPSFIRTLAAAYAETGQFNNAIETVSRALQLAKAQHNTALANELQQDVNLYRMRFPLRNHDLTNTHAVP